MTADEIVPEIGFHIVKEYWNIGYVTEAASACKECAFDMLNDSRIFSDTTLKYSFPESRREICLIAK